MNNSTATVFLYYLFINMTFSSVPSSFLDLLRMKSSIFLVEINVSRVSRTYHWPMFSNHWRSLRQTAWFRRSVHLDQKIQDLESVELSIDQRVLTFIISTKPNFSSLVISWSFWHRFDSLWLRSYDELKWKLWNRAEILLDIIVGDGEETRGFQTIERKQRSF